MNTEIYKRMLSELQTKSLSFPDDWKKPIREYYQTYICKADHTLEFYKSALKIYIKLFGQHSINCAKMMHGLALTYSTMKEHENAINIYHKIIESKKNLFNENVAFRLTLLNNLAVAYYEINEQRTLEILQECLDHGLKNFNRNHPVLTMIYCNLGSYMYRLGLFDLAILNYELALKVNMEELSIPELPIPYYNKALSKSGSSSDPECIYNTLILYSTYKIYLKLNKVEKAHEHFQLLLSRLLRFFDNNEDVEQVLSLIDKTVGTIYSLKHIKHIFNTAKVWMGSKWK